MFKFLTTIDFFKDEVKTVWLFEVLNELDNIFVTLAMVERLDLLQHSRPKILGKNTLVTKTVVLHLFSIGGPPKVNGWYRKDPYKNVNEVGNGVILRNYTINNCFCTFLL